jgi:hypothetical protein
MARRRTHDQGFTGQEGWDESGYGEGSETEGAEAGWLGTTTDPVMVPEPIPDPLSPPEHPEMVEYDWDKPNPAPERAPGPEYPAPPDGPYEPGPPLPLPDPGPYPPLPAPPRLPSPPPAPGPPRPVPPDEQILERSFEPPDFREPFFEGGEGSETEGRDFQPREDPGTIFSDFSPTAALPQTADKKLYQSDDPEEPGYGTTESFGDINPPFTAWPSDGMGETGGEDYPDEAGIPGVRRRRPGSELLDEEEVAAQRQEDEQRAEEYVPPSLDRPPEVPPGVIPEETPPEETPPEETPPTVPSGAAPEGVDPADPKWAQWLTESGRVPNEENIISFLRAHFGDQHSKAGLQAALPYLQWIFGEGIRIHPHEAGDTLILPDGSLIDVIAGVKGPTGGESWIWIPDAEDGAGGGGNVPPPGGDGGNVPPPGAGPPSPQIRRRTVDYGPPQGGGASQFAGYSDDEYQAAPEGGSPPGGWPPFTTPAYSQYATQGVGTDPLSQMTDLSLGSLLNTGGVADTPMAGTIDQTLRDILSSGGQLPALEDRRDRDRAMAIESARSPLDIMRRAQMSQGRAELARRGMVGGGAEREYGERLEERLAPQYTAAAQQIEMRERDREEQRLSNAMGLAAGMSQEQSRNLLNTARTVGERQQMLSNIALSALDRNMEWNKFLAEFGLDRAKVMEQISQGRLDALLPLLQQYLGAAQQAAGGFTYTD